jgi:hypothetical protein
VNKRDLLFCVIVSISVKAVTGMKVKKQKRGYVTFMTPIVIDIPFPPPLIPQRHRACLRHIGIGLHDTMAPSAVTWKVSHGRLGTRRLGTVITGL